MEYKMLVVDDEEAITSTLDAAFSGQGYKVIVKNSGKDAEEVIDKTPLDLIVLDIEMPGVSGLDVLKYIKDKRPDTKVIILTAYSEYEERAKKLGCDAFVTKPFTVGRLTSLITKLLGIKEDEEVKEYTVGVGLRYAKEGQAIASILLVEQIEPIAKVITEFLSDYQKTGAYYKVYTAETKEKAMATQDLLHTELCMMDLRTTDYPGEIVEALMKAKNPPKDFIFYLKPDYPKDHEKLKKVKAKQWHGNPFDEKALKKLSEIVKTTAIEHGLVKR